jgi:nucleoside recognition membrane protein YjiH
MQDIEDQLQPLSIAVVAGVPYWVVVAQQDLMEYLVLAQLLVVLVVLMAVAVVAVRLQVLARTVLAALEHLV